MGIRKIIIAVLLISFVSALGLFAAAQTGPKHYLEVRRTAAVSPDSRTIADAFLDEELVYEIGFWFLEDVAVGKVVLSKDEGGDYVAVLTAYTTGVADKIIKRKDVYTSRMRMTGDGKRFITKSFEKDVDNNGKKRKGVSVLDYSKGVMTWKSWDGEDKSGEVELPKGIYCDDPITAFYNFRYGVYGPIEEGRAYKIYTLPKPEKVPEISLRVASKEEMMEMANRKPPADYLALAAIDKELFGSQSGDVHIYFTEEMVPVQAVAKDILFFGDVKGRLASVGLGEGLKEASTIPARIPAALPSEP